VAIYVGLSGRFPRGTTVQAVGGPCVQRALPFPTTVLGTVTINRDIWIGEIPASVLRYLAVHELGHALGLVGVVQGEQPAWWDAAHQRYLGAMAIEGVRRVVGTRPGALYTQGAHWFAVGVDDVMVTAGPFSRISLVSIGALMDLGYPARWEGAGPY
jgi:hypothetical protein